MPVDNPTKEDKEFWENVLHDHHLGMGRGRRKWLVYGHEDQNKDAEQLPEENEW